MSFTTGFTKTAKVNPLGKGTTKFIKDVAGGVKDSGAETIVDTLKLKGLKHLTKAVERHGGIGMAMKSESGRAAVAHGLGKAAPALAAAALYGAGTRKVYNAIQDTKQRYGQQYHTYYGG